MNALVSVLVPIYNAIQYLPASIESILRQSHRNIELLLQDDGSTDDSLQVCRAYAGKDCRIRILEPFPSNRGLVVAQNALLAQASGDFIAWHDADDVSLDKRLEKQLIFLIENPRFGAVGTGIYLTDENLRITQELSFSPDPERQRVDPMLCCATVMTTRQAALDAGPLRQVFAAGGMDGDWLLRLMDRHLLTNISEALYCYRRHGMSITADINRVPLIRRLGVFARMAARDRRCGLGDPIDQWSEEGLPQHLGKDEIFAHPRLAAHEKMTALGVPLKGEAPLVSVLINPLRRGHHLAHLLQNLASQSFRNFEVVIGVEEGRERCASSTVAEYADLPTARIVSMPPSLDYRAEALVRNATGSIIVFWPLHGTVHPSQLGNYVQECLRHCNAPLWITKATRLASGDATRDLLTVNSEVLRGGLPELALPRQTAADIFKANLGEHFQAVQLTTELATAESRRDGMAFRIAQCALERLGLKARRLLRLHDGRAHP